MTAERIQQLITDALVNEEDFINDFCRDCEAISIEYGFKSCHCDFQPHDSLCVKSQQWNKIAEAIAKVAEVAEAPEYVDEAHEREGWADMQADSDYECARDMSE